MAKAKNQHYLPQHYLRRFSLPGGKQIHLYVINTNTFPPKPAAIKTQCSQDYFYSKDPEFEAFLSRIEGRVETLFSEICRTDSLPIDEPTKRDILAAMCVIHGRTRLFVERIDSLFEEAVKATMKKDPDFETITSLSKSQIDNFKFRDGSSPQKAVLQGLLAGYSVVDLGLKILEPGTNRRFITSDNPLVVTNQVFERLLPRQASRGLGMRGIQLFLPLAPDRCLLAYDPAVYRFRRGSRDCIKMTEEEVEIVNSLQLQNADQHIYFADAQDRAHIRHLTNRFARFRRRQTGFARTIDPAPQAADIPSFVSFEMPEIKIPAPWSFCRVRKGVSAEDFGLRDPARSEAYNAYRADMLERKRLVPFHVWISEQRTLHDLRQKKNRSTF